MYYCDNNLKLCGHSGLQGEFFEQEKKRLFRTCMDIDRNTTVQQLDYTDCRILHYLDTDRKEGKIYCSSMYPGRQMLFGREQGIPKIFLSDPGVLSLEKMQRSGAQELADHFAENPTAFQFAMNGRKDILFTSSASKKTMGVRLPVSECVSSLERDLLLAKKIGDMDGSLMLYTVMRNVGVYHLVIGMFFKEPKRASWNETASIAFRSGNVLWFGWMADQAEGLRLAVRYQAETDAIREKYPNCKYLPFHLFSTCDSGHYSDTVGSGWMMEDDPDRCFISRRHKSSVSWESALEESVKTHLEDAGLLADPLPVPFRSSEELAAHAVRVMDRCCVRSSVGTKAVKALAEYIAKNYTPGMTAGSLRSQVLEAVKDQVAEKVSDYAGTMFRDKSAGDLFHGLAVYQKEDFVHISGTKSPQETAV